MEKPWNYDLHTNQLQLPRSLKCKLISDIKEILSKCEKPEVAYSFLSHQNLSKTQVTKIRMLFFNTFKSLFSNYKQCIIIDPMTQETTMDFHMFLRLQDDQQFEPFYRTYFSNLETDPRSGRMSIVSKATLHQRSMSIMQRSASIMDRSMT
jgi:hypothetical protein